MKIKAINFNHRGAITRSNRWFTSYHKCINSPRCNKLFGVIFLMSIGAIFIAVIVTAVIRAELLHYKYDPNDTVSINFDTTEKFQESFTAGEHFDIANEFENSTLPMDRTFVNVNTSLDEIRNDLSDEDTTSSTESTTSTSTSTTSSSTTITSTTTTSTEPSTATQVPIVHKCNIFIDNALSSCTISCLEVENDNLKNEIDRVIDDDLPNYEDECFSNKLDLSLKSVRFSSNLIDAYWLGDLSVQLQSLTIESPINFVQLNTNVFNSSTFEQLTSLAINDVKELMIYNGTFNGLLQLEILRIRNVDKLLLLQETNLLILSRKLRLLEMSNIQNQWSPIGFLGHGGIYDKMNNIQFFSNNFTFITFNSTSFMGVRATITEINLRSSRISKLDEDAFLDCVKLRTINLSNNLLRSLPPTIFDSLESLDWLYLQNNLFTSLPEGLLSTHFTKTLNLQITNNPWICDTEIFYLRKMLENVNWKVSNAINCTDPEPLRGRRIIDLWCLVSSCKITCKDTIDSTVQVLKVFNVSSCGKIKLEIVDHDFGNGKISKHWLSNLTYKINTLNLFSTNLESFEDEAFNTTVMNELEEMTINGEFPENIALLLTNEKGLIGLNNLKVLDILNYFSISTSQSVSTLQGVSRSLTKLSITNIESLIFIRNLVGYVTFEKLKELDISGNQLNNSTFNNLTFSGVCESLEKLSMHSSKISSITMGTFDNFMKLQEIHLQNNNLVTLPTGIFHNLSNRGNLTVFLGNNLLKCDLDACHLRLVLDKEEEVLCKSPDELIDQPMSEFLKSCIDTTISIEPTTTTPLLTTTTNFTTTTANNSVTTTTTTPSTTTTSTTPSTTTTSTTPSTTSTSTATTTTSPETTTPSESTPFPTTTSTSTTLQTTTTTSDEDPEEITTTTTLPGGGGSEILIPCIERALSVKNQKSLMPFPYRDTITVYRPPVLFNISMNGNINEVRVTFEENNDELVMLYYPVFYDPFDDETDDDDDVNCIQINSTQIIINNLIFNTVYTFCVLENTQIITPFQCKSYVTTKGMPWLYKEQKVVVITSMTLLLLLMLVIGIIMTYFLIRRMPTLIRGSKRVVIVNNRTKEVMILPRSNNESNNNSIRKESSTPIIPEPPTYLTPLPRQSIDHHRPPFVRSNSDTSLKSYVSVSRLPPRFSQVYQRDDFDTDSIPRHRNGSYPRQLPSAPYQQSPELPPPLPRRSVVSASSAHHSIASSADFPRPPLSRSNNHHNSTFRRQHHAASRIEPEEENHYNFII